jgi:hypothetical protein
MATPKFYFPPASWGYSFIIQDQINQRTKIPLKARLGEGKRIFPFVDITVHVQPCRADWMTDRMTG